MPLVSSVDTVYYLLYDLRVAQLNSRSDFSPFFMSKSYSLYFGTPSPMLEVRQKSVCVIERISVCALTRIYITCTSTNYVDVPELTPPRPGTQPLVMLLCGFFWRSNRNHYLLVLVMHALAMSIHIRTYLPKFNNKTHYYGIIPTTLPWGLFLQ